MIPEGGRAIEDRRSESERKEHAVHVAGHVVAVRLMGGEVLYASIEPFVAKEGIEAMGVTEVAETDYEGHDPRTKEGFDFWVRQSAIKMAGDVAQHIYRNEKQTSHYALSNLDQTMLELLYRKYSPIEDNMLLTQAKTLGTGIVRLKLEEHWNEVLAVAEELTKGDLGEIDSTAKTTAGYDRERERQTTENRQTMRTSKHTRSIFIAAALLMAGCGGKVGEAYNQGNDDGYRDGYEQCKKTFSDLHLEQALAQGTMVLLYLYAMILIFQEICKP